MVTRLGLYGGSRGLYGSFAGKTEQTPLLGKGVRGGFFVSIARGGM
jgi:hypothetical protein